MPLAPTSVMAMPTSKPKIGFSIESIVGNRFSQKVLIDKDKKHHSSSPIKETSQPSDDISTQFFSSDIKKALRMPNCSPEELYNRLSGYESASPPSLYQSTSHENKNSEFHARHDAHTKTDIINRSPSPLSEDQICESSHAQKILSDSCSPPPAPIVVPGIPAGLVRPLPQPVPNVNEFKPIAPFIPSNDIVSSHNPHFIAAQFTAAALASQAFSPTVPQHVSHLHNSNLARDSYPLYPWLLSRHGRIFPHRFPGSK